MTNTALAAIGTILLAVAILGGSFQFAGLKIGKLTRMRVVGLALLGALAIALGLGMEWLATLR